MPQVNRRGFLSTLLGVAGVMALDPERALWVPGKKLISIPHQSQIDVLRRMYLTPAMKELAWRLDYNWAVGTGWRSRLNVTDENCSVWIES